MCSDSSESQEIGIFGNFQKLLPVFILQRSKVGGAIVVWTPAGLGERSTETETTGYQARG